MPNLNKADVMGHIGREPEVKHLNNGKAVCNFSIATNNSIRGGERMTERRNLALLACIECVRQDTGLEAVYEYRFHPVRKWRFDVAFPEQRVALEIEGAVWTRGRHTRGKGFIGDMEKYNSATQMGWRVYRCTWQEVENGQAVELLKGALEVVGC